MKDNLNILIVGKGGRESALAACIARSPRCRRLFSAPGPIEGTEASGVAPMDFEGLASFVKDNEIDMVVVGPEAPIVGGIYDVLSPLGVKVIAPDTECARLEGSKEFAKEFASRHAIPSPRFMSVTADTLDEGLSYLDSMQPPYVIKADGLAAGRGTILTESLAEGKEIISEMLAGLFGESSETVIVEEYIKGKECTIMLAVDGEDYIMLPTSMDYKRFLEGGHGQNTAGLGAVSPSVMADLGFLDKVQRRIIEPTLRGMREEGLDYHGFLYFGIISLDGEPLLLEYNVRLGDPEAQVVLPLVKSDFVEILEGIADRTLALKRLEADDLSAAGIVMAAKGYPGIAVKGDEVTGMEAARRKGCIVYPGAVRTDEEGRVITDGGRILTVVALAPVLSEAAEKAAEGAAAIDFDGKYYRSDIGKNL